MRCRGADALGRDEGRSAPGLLAPSLAQRPIALALEAPAAFARDWRRPAVKLVRRQTRSYRARGTPGSEGATSL